MRLSSFTFLTLLICGCQTNGDMGRTVIQEVARYGGHPLTSAAIPELHGSWHVESTDAEGFQAHLSGVSFANVQSFMQQVYGNPVTLHNSPGVWYAAKNIGVAIHLFDETNGVSFICQRGHAYPLL
jgi:hypothetical protein